MPFRQFRYKFRVLGTKNGEISAVKLSRCPFSKRKYPLSLLIPSSIRLEMTYMVIQVRFGIDGNVFHFIKANLYDSISHFPTYRRGYQGKNRIFSFSQGVILTIFQVKFHQFSFLILKIYIEIDGTALYIPQTKYI